MLRSPVVAGRFYAGTAEALASDVALCKKEGAAVAVAVPPGSEQPVAVMLPHAGHVYCGRVIGATLSGVRLPRLLVLLCPNHTGRGTPLSVWPGGAWRTPLGDVPCDDAFIASLTARAPFAADSLAHMGEHSLEVLLPFLQCLPGTESVIVPVCVGTAQPAVLRAAGVVLAELLAGRDDAAFVVSSDMNHYEPEKVTCIKDRAALESRLAAVQQASVSSHDFNEDSLAGVYDAVEKLSWGNYSSRLILLISDAGPLRGGDPYASVLLGPAEMNDLARQKGIWITALHIKSPSGSKNHAYAEQSYRTLSRLSGNRSNYQVINAPDAATGARQFGAVAATLAQGMVSMVKNTAAGKIMTRPKDEAPAQTPEEQARQLAATLGYAMQLQYFGAQRQNQAPSVVNSWIADMDLARLAKGGQSPTVEVAVLLTKNQLNDLSTQIKTIIDNAERTKKTDSRDFFRGILSASAQMARDPNLPTQGKSLAELGVLAEFLEGLPYKSDIMLLREEDWYRMSIGEQTAFINRLKSRLARYEEYDRDRANWESFGQSNAGDWVYRVPLNMLP